MDTIHSPKDIIDLDKKFHVDFTNAMASEVGSDDGFGGPGN